MSRLREELDSLQRDYRAAKYPGNLADDVIPPSAGRARRMRIVIAAVATFSGIAAAVMLYLNSGTHSVDQPKPAIAIATKPAEAIHAETAAVMPVAELQMVPSFPDDLPLVPSGDTLLPSAESIELGSIPLLPAPPGFEAQTSEFSLQEEPT